jgi:hypothetical protein
MILSRLLFFGILAGLVSCSEDKPYAEYVFEPVASSFSNLTFENTLTPNHDINILEYIYYFNGGGVAVGDINNDGLDDIFFTGNQVSNRLYLNKGDLIFEDISRRAGVESEGWSTGVSMVDINGDGFLDIYVCRSGYKEAEKRKNLFYINQGNATFREMAGLMGLADSAYSTQAAFFDYDLDGDLDLFLLNHMHQVSGMNNPVPRKLNGEAESTDKFYENTGIGTHGLPVFKDVSRQTGITIEGFGLGVGVSDINLDGYPDVYVSNDFLSNDILYVNQRNGRFKDLSANYLRHQSFNGMGSDIADINNDGLVDIMVLDMLPSDHRRRKLMLSKPNYNLFEFGKRIGYQPQYVRNTLQVNNGVLGDSTLRFSELGQFSGISSTDWSWGALMADFDMDGFKDLFITTGYLKDMTDLDFIVYRRNQFKFRNRKEADSIYLNSIARLPEVRLQNFIYKNNGDLRFSNKSTEWTSENPGFSNGAAYADFDNDGDLDLIVNNINEKVTLLKNTAVNRTSPNRHYLKVKFTGPLYNRSGIGSKVWMYTDSGIQYSENFITRGFLSGMGNALYFAVPEENKIDSLIVEWPGGNTKTYSKVPFDETFIVNFEDAKPPEDALKDLEDPLIKRNTGLLAFQHVENTHSDFNLEPLIPNKFSSNGPALAVSDVNGDQLEDVLVGGAYGFSTSLFVQNSAGGFESVPFDTDSNSEDAGAVFFDADNDGDRDLYIVNGGSEFSLMKPEFYQDRFYTNDGKGNFTKNPDAIPVINTSGSCVVATDYDRDGDTDLFVGGMVVPGAYGLLPRSYLLENRNGKFYDVTAEKLKDLTPGMISSAIWTDVDNDGFRDLMLVGKWMPITIYINRNGKTFTKMALEGTSGWWNSINGGDFDSDGDIDYIVGNLGHNTSFKGTPTHPLSLFVSDIDKDGRIDPIISGYFKKADKTWINVPLASRDLLADQIINIKSKYPNYAAYADSDISQLIADTMDDKVIQRIITTLGSSYLENLGSGRFQLKELPMEAQWSPILGTIISDLNMDGNLDLVLTGNFHEFEVGMGQSDSFLGLVLLGNGKGEFKPQTPINSGFISDGNTRALVRLISGNKELILSSVNNDSLKIFERQLNADGVTRISPEGDSGYIYFQSGDVRKFEIYSGEGYLSQSGRSFAIPASANIKYDN